MMTKLRSAVIFSALLFIASAAANAAVYDASFENNVGSQTISTPLTAADALAISGYLDSGAGAVTNITSFSVGAGVGGIELDAVWRSGAAGDALRLIGVNIDLLDSTSTVIASDTFSGVLNGFALSTLSFVGLAAGDYSIRLTGTNENIGQYIIDATFTPVPLPAAILMLAPALAGLGFTGRRSQRV